MSVDATTLHSPGAVAVTVYFAVSVPFASLPVYTWTVTGPGSLTFTWNVGFVTLERDLIGVRVTSGGSVLTTKVRDSLLPKPLPSELFSSATAV